jgi:hypothetical protein
LNAALPKAWPEPPGWNGGFGWSNPGNGQLQDPDGDRWHWHPEDTDHNEHWDCHERIRQGRYAKTRTDRQGNELEDSQVFKPRPSTQSQYSNNNDLDIDAIAREITGKKSVPVLTGIVAFGILVVVGVGEAILEGGLTSKGSSGFGI